MKNYFNIFEHHDPPEIAGVSFSEMLVKIYQTSRIRAKAFQSNVIESETAAADYYKSSLDRLSSILQVMYLSPPFERDYLGRKADGMYSLNYKAGGPKALIDGKTGTSDFTDGKWQGFEGKDMQVVIDTGKDMPVWRITASFLQSLSVWIFHPVEVSFSISTDGEDYRMLTVIDNYPDRATLKDGVKFFETLAYGASARYIKVRAKSMGLCPPWHHGAGGAAWLFADEVIVE